jgi:uncharacterized membrane protein YkoI
MRRGTKTTVGVAAAIVLAAGAGTAAFASTNPKPDPTSERAAERRFTDAHRDDVPVSQASAEQIARRLHPGTVVDTHLEDEGHGLRWEVKTDDGTQLWEIQLDPTSGVVASDRVEL